jgi:2-keto-4-pentenoate hydratase/2-oxohepta-3-ene-1,7-dioic acid hydratase in catechol pathway
MRLFSFRDVRGESATYLGIGGGLSYGQGIRVGRLFEDGTVEIAPDLRRPAAELTPAPAVLRPGKIVCIGWNYRSHVLEQHREMPTRPMLFAKFANAVIADGEPIVRPPGTHALDLEAELGVVIGRRASHVHRADALDHVLGYVVVNDVSARDWQGNKAALAAGEQGDGQWLRAKGSDTFLPMGPVLVTVDEVPDPGSLRVRSWLIQSTGPHAGDSLPMQEESTGDMIFDVPTLIEFISAAITLEPGDVIATGTPAGVGVYREPPVFLQPGDRVRCEVEGIGSVENTVVDWSDLPDPSAEAAVGG